MASDPHRLAYQQAANERTDRALAILVPCYRAAEFIADTLNGIQEQEGLDEYVWAVVLAPDASPDDTVDIARRTWRSKVPLLVDERARNVGEYTNVNTSVDQFPAHVQWFLIMHGDNIPKPGWLTDVATQSRQLPQQIALIGSSYDVLRLDGSTIAGEELPAEAPRVFDGEPASVAGTLMNGCWWHISSGAIRVSTFKQLGGLPVHMRQKGDWKYLLKVLAAGNGICYLPRTRMIYRENEISLSSANLRTHLDLRETDLVFREYQHYLSPGQRRSFRWYNLRTLARRTAGSLLRGQFRRAFAALGLMPSFFR